MSRYDEFDFDSIFQKDARDFDPMDFIKENDGTPAASRPKASAADGENYDGRHVRKTGTNPTAGYDGRHTRPQEPDYGRYASAPDQWPDTAAQPTQNTRPAQRTDASYGVQNARPVRRPDPVYSSENASADPWEDPVYEGYESRRAPRKAVRYDDYQERDSGRRARPEPEDYEDRRRREKGYKESRGIGAPLIILIVVLVGGILFAGWKLGNILWNYHRDRSAYSDLASTVISTPPRTTAAPDAAQTQVTTPSVPIHVNWTELRQQNSDVIGWLYCPNTIINYPVVQRADEDFYLDHGFDQQPNTSGTLFADFDSVAGIQLSNFIIYGHNMKDHSMFGTLTNYTDPSYWEQNPTFYYLTPNGNYRIELICAHIVESTINNFPARFGSAAEYQSYINQISASSFWVNPTAINTNYQLITLSTCSYTSGYVDPRFLVHGILIPVEE